MTIVGMVERNSLRWPRLAGVSKVKVRVFSGCLPVAGGPASRRLRPCRGDAQIALHHEHVKPGEPVRQLLAVGTLGDEVGQLLIETLQTTLKGQQMTSGDALHTQEQRQRAQHFQRLPRQIRGRATDFTGVLLALMPSRRVIGEEQIVVM